jgi:uncharacterized membrane protein
VGIGLGGRRVGAAVIAAWWLTSGVATPPAGAAERPAPRATYAVEQLALPPGYTSGTVAAINEKGIVVGQVSDDTAAPSRPVVWNRGRVRFLKVPKDATRAIVNDRSNNGVNVGEAIRADDGQRHAVVWTKRNKPRWLPEPTPSEFADATFSQALAVNDSGLVVGTFEDDGAGGFRMAAWSLGADGRGAGFALGPGGVAYDVNESGVAVGKSIDAPGPALLWRPPEVQPQQLPALADEFDSAATRINDQGTAVGEQTVFGDDGLTTFGVLWTDGEVRRLPLAPGTTGATPIAINDDGLIVGTQRDASGPAGLVVWENGVAHSWDADGTPVDINDRGTIVGTVGSLPVLWTRHTS